MGLMVLCASWDTPPALFLLCAWPCAGHSLGEMGVGDPCWNSFSVGVANSAEMEGLHGLTRLTGSRRVTQMRWGADGWGREGAALERLLGEASLS